MEYLQERRRFQGHQHWHESGHAYCAKQRRLVHKRGKQRKIHTGPVGVVVGARDAAALAFSTCSCKVMNAEPAGENWRTLCSFSRDE